MQSVSLKSSSSYYVFFINTYIAGGAKRKLRNEWTHAHGYSPESAQQELSNEYQHDRV